MKVLTAHIGDKDPLLEPLEVSDAAEYICYTNRPELKSTVWEVKQLRDPGWRSTRWPARQRKILAPIHYPHDDVLWVDGTFQLKKKPEDIVYPYLEDYDVLAMAHPHRDSIHEEAEVLHGRHGWDKALLDRQLQVFGRVMKIFQDHLTTTGLMAFRGGSFCVREFAKKWWELLQEGGHPRDQMSVDFALWLSDVKQGLLYGHYRNNPYAKFWAHGGKETKKMRISLCEKKGRKFVNHA